MKKLRRYAFACWQSFKVLLLGLKTVVWWKRGIFIRKQPFNSYNTVHRIRKACIQDKSMGQILSDHIDGQTFIEMILKDFKRFQFRLIVSRGSHVLYSHSYLTTWFTIYQFIDHNLRIWPKMTIFSQSVYGQHHIWHCVYILGFLFWLNAKW